MDLYQQLSQTDDLQVKVKQAVPLLNLIGLQIEAEFNLGEWAKKMNEKHQLRVFEVLWDLQRLG